MDDLEFDYEAQQTDLQKALARHFLQEGYNAFVTLTFRAENSVSYLDARKVFGRFMHGARCSLYKERSTYRMPLLPVMESYPGRPLCSGFPVDPNERTHFHCCINLPGSPQDHKDLIRRAWVDASGVCGDPKIYCPNSDQWFIEIATPVEMRRYVNYSLKQCRYDHEPVLWDFTRKIRTA